MLIIERSKLNVEFSYLISTVNGSEQVLYFSSPFFSTLLIQTLHWPLDLTTSSNKKKREEIIIARLLISVQYLNTSFNQSDIGN